jgi:SepF-like predicted cell division protein (DUF552 family)
MVTHFITVEIALLPSASELHRTILAELQTWGEPLRWAIAAIDVERQTVQVEAVITTPTELLIPNSAVRTI